MPEPDWRPRDAAERARERERARWYEAPHAPKPPPAGQVDKDAIFTSEEAVAHDKADIARFDNEDIVRSKAEEEVIPQVPSRDDYH